MPYHFYFSTPSYSTQAQALFAAMSVQPSPARKALINSTINQLIASGVWDLLDILYMLAANNEQAGRLNWKNPGTFTCTAVNSPTFTTDMGFAGDGATSYLDTGRAANVAGVYAQNDNHTGVWCTTNVAETTNPIGTANNFISPRTASDVFAARCQGTASQNVKTTIGTSVGHSLVTRNNSASFDGYKNGAVVASGIVDTSAAIGTTKWAICARNATTPAGFSTQQVGAAHFGSSLSSDQIAALYSILLAYLQAVGAA